MDEVTARSRSSSRRMASAKPAATTRKTSSSKKKDDGSEISPARWAGVALVVAALVGAIALAMVSPSTPRSSEPGIVAAPATPPAAASPVADAPVPGEQPRIVKPISGGGAIPEIDIDVVVAVPDTALRRGQLELVVLVDGAENGSVERPKVDTNVTVGGVRLQVGANTLTAALKGPGGGLGPQSEPVLVTVDRDAPELAITSPKSKSTTFDDTIVVRGTSEPGAEIRLHNQASDWDQDIVVGVAGTFEQVVPLKTGKNKIAVESVDQAGMDRRRTVNVERIPGRPVIELAQAPKQLKRSNLPRDVRVVVEVTDVAGGKMEGADVSFSLGGPGRTSETSSERTNDNGRAVWVVRVEPGAASSDTVILTVEVTSPHDVTRSVEREIPIS